MQKSISKTKQSVISNIHQCHFGEIVFRHDMKIDPKTKSIDGDTPSSHKKGAANIPWNSSLTK